jgi:hypothetical protein
MSNNLLAPNGKPSNLNAMQYELVRTPAFKKWFGDWENDPANASKVVDENGEPLVVYHGGRTKNINIFDSEKSGSVQYSDWGKGIYFTPYKSTADYYSNEAMIKADKLYNDFYEVYEKTQDYEDLKRFQQRGRELRGNKETIVYEVFLNIRKPLVEVVESMSYTDPFLSRQALESGKDGVIILNGAKKFDELLVFKSNQIKLADGTNKLFDANSDDIRFAKGGKTKGDCYLVAGQIAMEIRGKKIDYKGTPYLVHAEVKHSTLDGVRFGHAFIEDDENVYDFSNNREIIMPKQLYYYFGGINPKDKKKYRKYTFKQAREKMLSTGNYGCWDIDVKFNSGGEIVKSYKREIPDYLKMFLDL